MFKNLAILFGLALILCGCGSGSPSNVASNTNDSNMIPKEIKIDPANMPPGLSAKPLPPSANMPPGISVNAVNLPIGNKPVPGIPSAEQIKKGFKPGKTPIPGIPDEANIRKQMGLPKR
ncbi:MAG: hypothetical protein ACKVRN_08040 [Pyrinomonadaceae bacterium]